MSIEVMVYADASPRAIQAFEALVEFEGHRYRLPYRTPGIVAPPYDQWAWLFVPARSGRPAHEMVFAYGGDAGQILWQRDLIGPDPWRTFADEPGATPRARLVQHLTLRGNGFLPTAPLLSRYRKYAF